MATDQGRPAAGDWLNRTVIGAGVTSFLADVGYEMASAVLPGFLFVLGLPAAALGLIDGLADGLSNITKLLTGWLGDRIGRRKPFVVFGYALTGTAQSVWAWAGGLPLLLTGKVVAWMGKGIRGPLRNAILADAVAAADRGKAFGLHRTADTLGAILGPLLGAWLLVVLAPHFPETADVPFRWVFAFTLVPGVGSALAFALLVKERPPSGPRVHTMRAALAALPVPFRRYLVGVTVFGLGDCTRSLLILAAITLLTPGHGAFEAARNAALLYAWHNACQAVAAFPIGALSDRIGRRGLLAAGYVLGALDTLGIAAALVVGTDSIIVLALLFALSGVYVAAEESLESAVTADLVPESNVRGTAYGVLGVVNGLGDLVASLFVGGLWAVSPATGFVAAAGLMAAGAVCLRTIR